MGLINLGSTAPVRVSGTKQDPQNYLLYWDIREIKESITSLLYSSHGQGVYLYSGFPLSNGQRWPFPYSQKQGYLNKQVSTIVICMISNHIYWEPALCLMLWLRQHSSSRGSGRWEFWRPGLASGTLWSEKWTKTLIQIWGYWQNQRRVQSREWRQIPYGVWNYPY